MARFFVSVDAAAAGDQPGLTQLARCADVRIAYRQPGDTDAAFFFWPAAIEQAVAWSRPDWMLLIDSDEFALARGGDLRGVADLQRHDILQLPRRNVPLVRDADEQIVVPPIAQPTELTMVERVSDTDLAEIAADLPPWILTAVAPKLLLRPGSVERVLIGAHAALPIDTARTMGPASDIVVAHVPFSSFERFARKAARIQHILDEHGHRFGAQEAQHWKRWSELARRGELEWEFRRQTFDAPAAQRMRAAGVLVTAGEHFAASAAS